MSTINLNEISPMRPLVISSYEDLLAVAKQMLTDAGVLKAQETLPARTRTHEIGTEAVREILLQKGYMAKSTSGLSGVLGEYKIKPIKKRGRNNYYLTADIEKIPNLK